jgi:hypothetical protein
LWRSFKLKLLAVMLLVAVVGLIMQNGNRSRQLVEPVLQVIMENKYDVSGLIAQYIPIDSSDDILSLVPASSGLVLRQPCPYTTIQRHYGWYWDQEKRKETFSPGISLEVMDDTEIRAMLPGRVAEVTRNADEISVLINHEANLASWYSGLKDVTVKQGGITGDNEIIGHSNRSLYFEVRGKDGPVNPQSIFE